MDILLCMIGVTGIVGMVWLDIRTVKAVGIEQLELTRQAWTLKLSCT